MNADLALGYLDKPWKICKADSGAIRFKVKGTGVKPTLILINKKCPHEPLYHIVIGENSQFYDLKNPNEHVTFHIPNFDHNNANDFLLIWLNDIIHVGKANEPAALEYPEVNKNEDKQVIGFIKFKTSYDYGTADWTFESPPNIYNSIGVPRKVSDGKLRWVKMRTGDLLPIDAMVAGFENEPLYIARAEHRGSLCPGKYMKSKQHAFVPWGHIELPKDEFEVLCGYDATWVKCLRNQIPENAFIGGTSEVRDEPLFIGRAMIDNNLIPGKVHMLYKTCYLPYGGGEVERYVYEILVASDRPTYGESCDSLCHMKMTMEPCI